VKKVRSSLIDVQPFEICSIRPPTENYSLTFRLTRNCHWNKCAFCPVYKFGARFSRRTLEEIFEDIERAKFIDDLIFQGRVDIPMSEFPRSEYDRARHIVEEIYKAKRAAGQAVDEDRRPGLQEDTVDQRRSWFASWFREDPTIEDSVNHILTWRMAGGETCFLGDSDGLVLKPDFLGAVIDRVKMSFPSVRRFTIYGRTKSAAQLRSPEELRAFREAGLHRIHFGLESGSDKVLDLICKGVTSSDHIKGCLNAKEAGLSCSVYVMPGIGGKELSGEHAHETARVLNEIGPDFIRLRTLEIFPETPLAHARNGGTFVECDEEQMVRELRVMIEKIEVPTEILSDSAANLLDLFGRLPEDRIRLLEAIDGYLYLPAREKLIFSLNSRLHSFIGQYGRLSEDILAVLQPFIQDKRIDTATATTEDLQKIILLIRSKLMP
jgi:radical SAM superfamily enzyme YgiQ (UPF0313 family)